ncbi:MAG TPA: hypothetical protein VFB80_17350, partial [Pirellulaceae bacterium]|nr:hypothetical protein [Pirellulaceae bacterium]
MRCFTAGLLIALLGASGFAKAADEPAGQFITLELVVADAPEGTPATPTAAAILELEKAGKLTSFSRYRLTALENQQSSLQFGELASLISGRQQGFRGAEGGVPTFNQMSVGTMISA